MGAASVSIILSILKQGDTYGYEIMKQLNELSHGRIKWKEGSLYPVLKRLEAENRVKSYWNTTGYGRPRKYYTLLPEGEKALQHEKEDWALMQSIFSSLWDTSVQ